MFVSMSFIRAISNGTFPSQSAPKVLLDTNKDLIFIMELYELHKIGRKSTRSSLGNKTQTLYFQNNHPSWLSKIINGHCVKSVQIRSFFWSVFSRIRTEYEEILRISPYSVRMRENTDQKKLRIWTLFTQWDFAAWFAIFCVSFVENFEKFTKIIEKNLLLEEFEFCDLRRSNRNTDLKVH